MNSQPDNNGISPAQKLFNRNTRTNLPSFQSLSKTAHTNIPIFSEKKAKLPEIDPGTTVRIRTDEEKTWNKQGTIISKNNRPRSYNVLNEKGNILTRNRRHLIPSKEKFTPKYTYENIVPPDAITIPQSVTNNKPNIVEKPNIIVNTENENKPEIAKHSTN